MKTYLINTNVTWDLKFNESLDLNFGSRFLLEPEHDDGFKTEIKYWKVVEYGDRQDKIKIIINDPNVILSRGGYICQCKNIYNQYVFSNQIYFNFIPTVNGVMESSSLYKKVNEELELIVEEVDPSVSITGNINDIVLKTNVSGNLCIPANMDINNGDKLNIILKDINGFIFPTMVFILYCDLNAIDTLTFPIVNSIISKNTTVSQYPNITKADFRLSSDYIAEDLYVTLRQFDELTDFNITEFCLPNTAYGQVDVNTQSDGYLSKLWGTIRFPDSLSSNVILGNIFNNSEIKNVIF